MTGGRFLLAWCIGMAWLIGWLVSRSLHSAAALFTVVSH